MSKAGVSAKWDNDFDPYENRNLENGLTRLESLMNLVKGCLGTGIFALPHAFYFVGMINGVIGFLLLSLFAVYCLHMIVRSQYCLCKYKKVGLLTFSESMAVAFEIGPACLASHARFVGHFTNVLFIIFQYGALCVYVIFIAESLKLIGDQYTKNPINLYLYTLMIFTPCALVMCVRNLKIFAPFSFLANLITLATLGVLTYYVSGDLPAFSSNPSFSSDIKHYPLSFGIALFAIQSVPVITSVENAMDDAKFFLAPFGTLNMGLGIVTMLYLFVGVMGYWRYGKDTDSSILQNFPPEEITAQVIGASYSLALVVSYGLQGIIPITIIWNNYVLPRLEKKEAGEKTVAVYNYTLRLGLCVLTFILSVNIPLLGPIISLIGGVCLSTIGIVFPALLEICVLWPDGFGKFRWILWKDALIFFVGILGLVSSMYASISDIVIELSKRSSFEI